MWKLLFVSLVIFCVSCFVSPPAILSPAESTEIAYHLQTRYEITGDSMLPSFPVGNILIIDEEAYQQTLPVRGDIIVTQHPYNSDLTFVKRIIGLPNEQIEIVDGDVFIDGVLLIEPYIAEAAAYKGNWHMDEDDYFVLGDNRNGSSDSHIWGSLAAEFIIGKAMSMCETDAPEKCTDIPAIVYENDS